MRHSCADRRDDPIDQQNPRCLKSESDSSSSTCIATSLKLTQTIDPSGASRIALASCSVIAARYRPALNLKSGVAKAKHQPMPALSLSERLKALKQAK